METYLNYSLKFTLVMEGALLLLLMGIEVFFRYVLNNALSWPEEIAGFVFVWFTLLGTAYLVGENSHISFSLVSSRSSKTVKIFLFILSQILILIYTYFMIVPGYEYVREFGFVLSPAASIKMKWVYLSVPVSGFIIVIYVALNLFKFIIGENEPD